jgi:ATP-dependent protease HslVU ATPase subunit
MSPRHVVSILDSYIVGQSKAKRAVAIALRNRWRRRQLTDEGLQGDIVPKNILMIGPTGVGKTEVSRRMARITDAPFVKVEATKYTEVGFKGKDVESIIEDLYANAKTKARRRLEVERSEEALQMARDTVFSALTRQHAEQHGSLTLEAFIAQLPQLEDVIVTIDISMPAPDKGPRGGMHLPSVEALFGMLPEKAKRIRQSVTKSVKEAIPLAKQEALDKLVDEQQVLTLAKELAEHEGIVFIDEIDKVVADLSSANADVSSLGVQQDLLPLIEGSTVTLKDGATIATDNVLFICSGAFHMVKPSDMIAELQGRLPVRVELDALTESEFRRILTEPKANLLMQQVALLSTEGIKLEFSEEGISAIARITAQVNGSAQNIGARRLHTIIERVVDEYSFNCDTYSGKSVVVDREVVEKATSQFLSKVDLAKYLL